MAKKVFTDESLETFVDEIKTYTDTAVSTKANSSHNHAASNITSGTLSSSRLPTVPISKGGTGATTAAAALTNLGLTATAAELNKLDGVTATTAELNYVDGVTSNIQTQLDGKAASSHTHSAATTSANGFMSAADKAKLDGIATGANKFTLPYRLASAQGSSTGSLTDPNSGIETGFYYVKGTTNRPPFSQSANDDYRLLVTAYGNTWLQQIATDFRCDDIFYRRLENGTWKSWIKIYPISSATTSAAGLMSASDKTKLDGIATGANKIAVDSALSSTSTNPVQNKVVNTALSAKQATITGGATTIASSNLTASMALVSDSNGKVAVSAVTSTELGYLDGVTSNIQTQLSGKASSSHSHSTMTGASSSAAGAAGFVPAPAKGNQSKYLRGDGTWSTPTNTTYSAATTSAAGLMSAADKTKLDGITSGANLYSHPTYTAKSSGLYKVTVDASGHVSATTAVTKADITALGIPGSDTNTTYGAATASAAGLMSAADKTKLDGIAAGANAYSLPTASSSTLGGVKTTSTVTSTSGLTACPIISGVPYYKNTNTTYSNFVKSGSGAKAGLVPAPSTTAGTTKYLREDGTWAVPPDTNTTYSNFVKSGSGAKAGLVPAPSTTAGTTKYLREDGTWAVPPDTNTTYSAATTSASGLMTAAMVTKLNGIATGANAYTLPTASSSTLGGVKTTSTVTSTSGYTACPIISGVPYYKDTNTTYSLSSFGITATAAELNYCDGVTSNIQTQLNGKAASSHGNHVPATETANNAKFLRNDNTWQTVTPANIGAAASSHNHSASNITSGTLSVARGGTGVTSHADTTYTTARYRASALVSAETNPTTNGVINWTYE